MLTIRRFQKGDEEILSVMIRRTLREVNYTSPKSELDYLIPHYSPETMVELSETGHTYVLEEDGQIIGSGTVLPDGETEAEIVAAFLSPESIGKGYGRKLFETLEADELAAMATRVWLTSSDMAVEFYTMYGGFLFLGVFLGLLFLGESKRPPCPGGRGQPALYGKTEINKTDRFSGPFFP